VLTASVIIPNYNHAQYLRQRIDSVIRQSLHDIEIILLDDASSDVSVDIIASYASENRNLRIFCNTINSGSPFKQWDFVIRQAMGKYIWISEVPILNGLRGTSKDLAAFRLRITTFTIGPWSKGPQE
jgi:glycosyltransferase involved in cell wall biosynthesis